MMRRIMLGILLKVPKLLLEFRIFIINREWRTKRVRHVFSAKEAAESTRNVSPDF